MSKTNPQAGIGLALPARAQRQDSAAPQQQEALESLGRAMRLDLDYTEAYLRRGFAYKELKQPDRAIAANPQAEWQVSELNVTSVE